MKPATAAEDAKIIARRCTHCDFSMGTRGMDRCARCDGTGSQLYCLDRRFPNTEGGFFAALKHLRQQEDQT